VPSESFVLNMLTLRLSDPLAIGVNVKVEVFDVPFSISIVNELSVKLTFEWLIVPVIVPFPVPVLLNITSTL